MVTNFSLRLWRRPSHFSSTPIIVSAGRGVVRSQRSMALSSARRTVCQLRPHLVATWFNGIE